MVAALTSTRVALEALLPVPATRVGHGDVLFGDKVVAIIAHVAFGPQSLAVQFLQEVDRAIGRGNIPADSRLLLHVVAQEFPQGLAEDHVLEVGDFGENLLGKCVRYGTHKQRMLWLTVDDALEDVVPFDAREKVKVRRLRVDKSLRRVWGVGWLGCHFMFCFKLKACI